MIWDPGRRRCFAAAMKDSMAATWALMLFLLPTAPVSAARYASALTEPAQTQPNCQTALIVALPYTRWHQRALVLQIQPNPFRNGL